jgi:hypothetical protein
MWECGSEENGKPKENSGSEKNFFIHAFYKTVIYFLT